jgi:hypothetical protein
VTRLLLPSLGFLAAHLLLIGAAVAVSALQ